MGLVVGKLLRGGNSSTIRANKTSAGIIEITQISKEQVDKCKKS